MYSQEEREWYFIDIVNKLKKSDLIEGIVQLGSGVIGYKDQYSDIDLMISTDDDVVRVKKIVQQSLRDLGTFFIKEVTLRKDIYLLIAFLENGLEFNLSVLTTKALNVKSPLWKIIYDRTGNVTEIMKNEHEIFIEKPLKYPIDDDIAFEFLYFRKKFNTELKRNNLIYALQMLEAMRKLTLHIQAFNEEKKLHQFKAYETLNPEFINVFLGTYPSEITIESLQDSSEKLEELFFKIINQSKVFSKDEQLIKLLKQ
ncbi:hypothetical protein CN514_02490 [Bacillus sp. AFS001701]|uniref:hypothetical protein n=1 Tax=Bacillus sp. AFS001701 TaxID=2033480 RepID=UPI000BFA3572|nr:hypothetical protein [Bacillus sp. AFS001701]PET76369.1 hypothetical protein CN514_02490 [Bacillus sp. AFS001701]